MLGNIDAVRGISSCEILEGHPLNISDHLPILCSLNLTHVRHPISTAFPTKHLDWSQAFKTGTIAQYAKSCDDIARPLLGKDYSCIEEVKEDIHAVCRKITDAANSLIQRKKVKTGGRLKDQELSHLCWKNRCAFRQWKEAGRPRSGPEFKLRKQCKKEVRSHLNKCKANQEHKQIQRRDELFRQNHPYRFRNQCHQKAACTNLFSQGCLITDTKGLLKCWADHFSSLGQSKCSSNEFLRKLQLQIS